MGDRDPRVYFAAERTLLAWVRTGVTVIGIGFVVARFGLFLRIMSAQQPDPGRVAVSGAVGSGLAIVGGVITALAAVQFLAFSRELSDDERPRVRITAVLSVVLACIVCALGIGLGLFLWE